MVTRITDRMRYRQRIADLVKKPPTNVTGTGSELDVHAHWAKYTCVLVSGFLEQAIKEIFLEHAYANSSPRVRKYVAGTWPTSKNMKCDAIKEILGHFDGMWVTGFEEWLNGSERRKEINEIINWRNAIAHGKEENTNNVTLASVSNKFEIACDLIDYIEELLK